VIERRPKRRRFGLVAMLLAADHRFR